jgi:hypothetical protein
MDSIRPRAYTAVVLTLAAALSACPYWSHTASAEPGGGGFVGNVDGGAARVGLTRGEARKVVTAGERAGIEYTYASISFCAVDPNDPARDEICSAAFAECAGNTPEQGLGPAIKIFRQAAGESTWEFRGISCFPDLVGGGPALSMDMIISAFHDTAFSVPSINIQPEGDVTLVTLPTYYEVRFPAEGYEPAEIDTVSLLGFSVDIRPRLDAVTYHFGDGATAGPTTDLGGPHPTGGIVHEYSQKGSFPVRADITYGGQFRVNGGDWSDIPGTATITGTESTLTVMESRARLVTGDG